MTSPETAAPAGPRPDVLAGLQTKTRPVVFAMSSPVSMLLAVGLIAYGAYAIEWRLFGVSAAFPVAILGLGLLVVQGWMREITLASAGVWCSAMYYFNWLDRDDQGIGLPWGIAALIAVAIATTFMAGIAAVSSNLPPVYLIILTLGLQIAIERTIYPIGYLSGGVGGGNAAGPLMNPRGDLLGADLSDDRVFYFFALAWLVVVLVLLIRLRRSPAGLGFVLVGAQRQAALALGIPAVRFRVIAFAIAGLLAGVAGVLGAMLYESPPVFLGFDVEKSLLLLAIPVIAGVDSMAAIIVVATYLTMAPIELQNYHVDQNFIYAVALAVGALFGVRGIGGRMQDLERRRRFGRRRQRTKRKRMATPVLRAATGLADERTSVLTTAERAACLEVIERWLPPRPATGPAVRTCDVRLSFGPIHALTGVSIEVPVGQMVGLIGPNGAGKTTLFDVVSGFTAPDAGRVELFGRDVTGTSAWSRSRLGMTRTFQNTRVIPELTAGDNICAGAWQSVQAGTGSFLLGLPGAWARMRAAEEVGYAAARLLDVHVYWDERVGTLEFSARRRIEIARALVAGPRLLLLDEPAAGLDPASSSAMFSLIRRLHSDLGLTVLIVEHYVKAVLDTCDFVHVLAEGAVLASGTPAEVSADTEVKNSYLGTRPHYLRPPDAEPVSG